MTLEEFKASGDKIAMRLGENNSLRDYFLTHAGRLHRSAEIFGVFSSPVGSVLEIGPFHGYLPFILRQQASSYTVLEGDDPVVRQLDRLYQEHRIDLRYIDFAEVFGPLRTASHQLDFPDNSFDTIFCWETMEHFNFNPVKLVREFHRIIKPGGRVCITVPNKASWQNIFSLLTGKGDDEKIKAFYTFEDYEIDGKKAFHGYHWREYSPSEMPNLLSKAGFKIQAAGSFTSFQPRQNLSLARRGVRAVIKAAGAVFPRHQTHVYTVATK